MVRPHAVVSLALALVAFATPAASASGPVAATTSGGVEDVLAGDVKEWRAIPYAAPPLGDLRWRPPAAVAPWSGVRDATAFGPPCIQLDPAGGTLGSEDCLYLNVFAPSTATSTSRLAVMVHLHPGGNTFFWPYTDAAAFTERGVIVVTLAYRLGVFGFAGHPALTAEGGSSGEYGLLDQLAALQWVHGNIAAFGGDPGRVTLFGSSAGSFDTTALMASPLSRGLISGAAVQGEPIDGLSADNSIAGAEELGASVADTVGCAASTDVLACLRATTASELVEAAGPLNIVPWIGGIVLPKPPLELLAEHASLSLLVGFDREEDVFDKLDPATGALVSPYTTGDWVIDTNRLVGPRYAEQARSLYPGSDYDSLLWSYVR